MTVPDPSIELMRLINGYQVSQALHVAATLGVADQLKDGPKSFDALAQACGAHPASLYRLLRALATVGVFRETGNKEFSLTPLGGLLAGDALGSRRNYARWIGTPGHAWTYRMQNPEERAIFDGAMTGNSRSEAQAALEAYDFSQFGCVVDVGGGQGLLLKEILLACPDTRGVLFDQRQVVASADQVLRSAGLAQRCQIVAGSFLETVPEDGDVYVMKAILHDWDDRASIDILRTCRRAMSPTATLVVIERVVGPPNEIPEGKFSDLNMMIQYGALERTRQEFDDLFRSAGFAMTEIVPTKSPLSIIVGQPMST